VILPIFYRDFNTSLAMGVRPLLLEWHGSVMTSE